MHDVAGGVERHHLAARHHHGGVGVLAAQGHREAAAHHVAQHVVQHVVGLVHLEGLELLEQVERRDDAAPRASHAGDGAACLHAEHAVVGDAHDLLQRGRTALAHAVKHRGHRGASRVQRARVRLGVAAHLHHAPPPLGQRRRQVARGGGFADAAFPIQREPVHRAPLPRGPLTRASSLA